MVIAVEFKTLKESLKFLKEFNKNNPPCHVTAFYIQGEIIVDMCGTMKIPNGFFHIEIKEDEVFARLKNPDGANFKVPLLKANNFVGFIEYIEPLKTKDKC